MHCAQDQFVAHVFHCDPSAGALCKTIEAACKVLPSSRDFISVDTELCSRRQRQGIDFSNGPSWHRETCGVKSMLHEGRKQTHRLRHMDTFDSRQKAVSAVLSNSATKKMTDCQTYNVQSDVF